MHPHSDPNPMFNAEQDPATNHALCDIVTTRWFAVPRGLLFQAWTDAEHLQRWWGPLGFTNTMHEFDLRVGGMWRFTMHGPDGASYENECQFVEIAPPERLVFQHVSQPRFLVTALFEERGTQTLLTWRMRFETAEECARVKDICIPSNEQNLDRLTAQLAIMVGRST